MKILSFLAQNVHGFLNIKVDFRSDLTFLTGINGSGKTTVVRGITALLTPSVSLLSQLSYEKLTVTVDNNGKQITIESTRENDLVIVRCSLVDRQMSFLAMSSENFEHDLRYRERTSDRIREIETALVADPVYKTIRALPSPMVLGIERRYTSEQIDEDDLLSARIRRRSALRSTNPLHSALAQAGDIADAAYKRVQFQQRNLTDQLRRDMILNAIRFEDRNSTNLAILKMDVARAQATVKNNLDKLDLTQVEIASAIDPFFQKLEQLKEVIQDETDLSKLINSDDSVKMQAVVDLIGNSAQFTRVNRMINLLKSYEQEKIESSRSIDRYLRIINSFLSDSQKQIVFDDQGILMVRMRNGNLAPITSLSSGESQILVIITHLALNQAVQNDRVFIVDEPELSLHVRWQELFVDSIQEVNPALQLILATHSPSIILDRVENCVDLTWHHD